MVRNLKQILIWHDATECLPPESGNYWCITGTDIDGYGHLSDLTYSRKHGEFNVTDNQENDKYKIKVLYWTEAQKVKAIDLDYEEDW